ncbi:MAG: alkaline phosphatase D family protein [Deltaproteobacteria bacterium]|nr:alkaline phosphatase D family protein [Deltaproteobacteria bacterium]
MPVGKKHLSLALLFLVLFDSPVAFTKQEEGLTPLKRAPMIGLLQKNRLPVLVKGREKTRGRIHFKESGSEESRSTAWYPLDPKNDFSANMWLEEVKPSAVYEYRVELEGNQPGEWKSFRTPPSAEQPAKFRFAFSSCFREKYKPHVIFDFLKNEELGFMALLGDNMYGDYDGDLNDIDKTEKNSSRPGKLLDEGEPPLREKSVLEAFRNKYQRNFDKPFQAFSSVTPMIAMWDDRDYGQDGSDASFPHKKIARQVFLETFPSSPFQDPEGGLYHQWTIGNVDFFVIDNRWYRSPMGPDGPNHTMLGEKQLAWLQNGLKRSQESGRPFKVILGGVSWNNIGGDKSKDRKWWDNWEGYALERQKILDFIKENRITGVLTLSGDQHFPSAHILNWNEATTPLATPLKTLKAKKPQENTVGYSLAQNPAAVFDLSASPLDYKRAPGFVLPAEAVSPEIMEIYRIPWGYENHPSYPFRAKKVESIYGLVEVDTEGANPTLSVTFKQLDFESGQLKNLYNIKISEKERLEISSDDRSGPAPVRR